MNLQNSRITVCADHSWGPVDYTQALGRTCRRGQIHTCTHVDLVANKVQARHVTRLRRNQGLDAEVAEWQEVEQVRLGVYLDPVSQQWVTH